MSDHGSKVTEYAVLWGDGDLDEYNTEKTEALRVVEDANRLEAEGDEDYEGARLMTRTKTVLLTPGYPPSATVAR